MIFASKSLAICLTVFAVLLGSLDSAGAYGGRSGVPVETASGRADAPGLIRIAAEDCSNAADRAASQTGGRVLSVSTRQQGGKMVCVVTVLVPGRDGDRPRKKTVTIRP